MAKLTERQKARKEYIAGGVSYAEIAKKYKKSESTIKRWAAKDGWQEAKAKVAQKTAQKTEEAVADAAAGVTRNVLGVAQELLNKLANSLDMEPAVMEASAIRVYAAALKDIQSIRGEYGGTDLDAQLARIEKLQKDAEQRKLQNEKLTGGGNDVEVTLTGVEDYAG